MRVGYTGRGLVYALVGSLTAFSAWRGGSGETAKSALAALRELPLGALAVFVLGLALLTYAVWRLANAWFDLDRDGAEASGVAARLAKAGIGLVYGAVGGVALTVAFGATGGDGESGIDAMTAAVLSWPFGRWIVGLGGLATLGTGLLYFKRAWGEDYREKIVANALTERLRPLLRLGLVAHGVVVALMGAFLIAAAWTFDGARAGGLGQAFDAIRGVTAGRVMLFAVALGLVAFALVCFVNAAYRLVPARIDPDDDRRVLSGKRAGDALG